MREAIVQAAVMSPLAAWENFYVIVGSASGALTGLTFVVVTLVARVERGANDQGIAAFTTPTTVHFGAVLFDAAVLSAPWPTLEPLAILLGLTGLAGVLYTIIVVRRQIRLEDYAPVLEDWVFYAFVPFIVFAAQIVAAVILPSNPSAALFAVGGILILLLFLGIRNAWDIVTYIATVRLTPPAREDAQQE